MEEEGGEIRGFRGIGSWDYLQILPEKTDEMLILENYNAAYTCVSPFLSSRYFQVLETVTKIVSAPNFPGVLFL